MSMCESTWADEDYSKAASDRSDLPLDTSGQVTFFSLGFQGLSLELDGHRLVVAHVGAVKKSTRL